MRKAGWLVAGVVPVAVAGWIFLRPENAKPPIAPPPALASSEPKPPAPPSPSTPADDGDGHDDDRSYVFRMPSGEATALTCDEARTIVDQVRAGLAYVPEAVQPAALATSTSDWLDPHGLLSLAKDAPTSRAIARAAPEILADIEGRRQRPCTSAIAPGAALEAWSADLREQFDRGRREQGGVDIATAISEPLPPTGLAREVAREIGRRVGVFEATHGADARPFAEEAGKHFFPPLDKNGWARVVLASAVRAYVPLVDPHGEWAPFDEESRIYEVDLASRPPSRLWSRAVPTAVGVRITDGAAPPLAIDDVVLSVGPVTTAGLPLEQVDQLGYAASDARSPLGAVVVRGGAIVKLDLGKANDTAASSGPRAPDLPTERIAFGDGDVLVVAIKDVRDDLGDDLAQLIATERERGPRKLAGVVLDLRGNGGGSTDGALGALSLFLPGAPLFAMKRRDGTIEIDRAPVPRDRERWTGPVATLVDATTASAAEMIAGALQAYKRGPGVGTTTFGKGCAQEYVDDDAHAGVLRLTTLVYALPDGAPVQRIGLAPQVHFPFVPAPSDSGTQDRESKLAHSAPPWRGPDLRDISQVHPDDTAWPPHGGAVGPCHEPETCRALRMLGSPKRPAVAKH
ncbi:MAG TPA: S41 family peptidase [Labilithrix sp.]